MPGSRGITRSSTLNLSLPCDLSSVRDAAEAAHRFFADTGWAEPEIAACELALVEACNNAIQYARPGAGARPILIQIRNGPGYAELSVFDHTPGFEWPDVVTLPAAGRERGRGLYLIRRVMDSATYTRGRNGNLLVLRKLRRV